MISAKKLILSGWSSIKIILLLVKAKKIWSLRNSRRKKDSIKEGPSLMNAQIL